MDGIETLLALKAPQGGPRFIVASGGGALCDPRFLNMASRLGADATMQKPVSLHALVSEVDRLAAGA